MGINIFKKKKLILKIAFQFSVFRNDQNRFHLIKETLLIKDLGDIFVK